MTSKILISVVIPCFNEINYIKMCLDSLLQQTLSVDQFELIIVDGMSTDGTREILFNYCSQFQNVHMFDNVKRKTSVACNLGIENAKADFIAICGSHTFYNSDYLENGLKLFVQHPQVECVGGPIYSDGISTFSKAAALASSNLLGVGNAKHRFPETEGHSIFPQYPVFRKTVFEKVGLYNEELSLNEDDEFFSRLKKVGIKSFISPSVKCTYFVRKNPMGLFKQYFNYGFWRWIVFKDYDVTFAYRQLVPTLFILLIISLLIIGIIYNSLIVAIILPVLYSIVLLTQSIQVISKHGLVMGIYFIFSIVILHFSYGIGFLVGFLSKFINKK